MYFQRVYLAAPESLYFSYVINFLKKSAFLGRKSTLFESSSMIAMLKILFGLFLVFVKSLY